MALYGFLMSKSKGSRWERHYRNAFNTERGDDLSDAERVGVEDVDMIHPFFAMRAPSSGSAYAGALPDVHVWVNDPHDVGEPPKQYAAEVKAGRDRVHFDKIDDLDDYCARTGADPIAIVHLDYEGDFVFRKDELHQTDAGNHTVTKTRDAASARTFADFVDQPYI